MKKTTTMGILDLRSGTKIKQLLKQKKSITITDRGTPVAMLTPLPTESDTKRVATAIEIIRKISRDHPYPFKRPINSEDIYE